MHCDVTSMIFAYIIQSKISRERSKIMNFYKRSYQPILRYLYTETIKLRGEISLLRHFKGSTRKNVNRSLVHLLTIFSNFFYLHTTLKCIKNL